MCKALLWMLGWIGRLVGWLVVGLGGRRLQMLCKYVCSKVR